MWIYMWKAMAIRKFSKPRCYAVRMHRRTIFLCENIARVFPTLPLLNFVLVLKLYVQEYVTAYYEAAPLVSADLPNGYRKLWDLGNYVFTAKQMANSSYEFVTWEYSYDRRGVGHGNYFYDYEAAKTDFGIRTGMIDRSKLFSEKEILFLYKHLSHYLSLNNYISFDDEKEVQSLFEKMNDIAPECHSEYMSAVESNNNLEDEHE